MSEITNPQSYCGDLTFFTRISPSEGMNVQDTFIPGNIKIPAPRYSIGRRKPSSLAPNLLIVDQRCAYLLDCS